MADLSSDFITTGMKVNLDELYFVAEKLAQVRGGESALKEIQANC